MEARVVCRLCEQQLHFASFVPDICRECANTIGMEPMPPPRRRPVPCARCNGVRFARSIPRDFSGELDYPYPMRVAQVPELEGRLMRAGRIVQRPDPVSGAGTLEVYTCLGCGFVEWYCQDPENIPIGPEYMTDLVDYGGEGPYR